MVQIKSGVPFDFKKLSEIEEGALNILRINENNSFYFFDKKIIQIDDLDYWQWEGEYNFDEIIDFLETEIQNWEDERKGGYERDFEPCQWLTDFFAKK